MRVFHGISGAAGQPYLLSEAEKKLGYTSHYHAIENISPYYKKSDFIIKKDNIRTKNALLLTLNLASKYDIFVFYSRSFIPFKSSLLGLDLLVLRMMGKKIIFKFRGGEARTGSLFRELSPYNYVDDIPDLFTNEHERRSWINFVSKICDEVHVPDPELASYVPNSIVSKRLVPDELFLEGNNNKSEVIKIIHAPTRKVIKGTEWVEQAIEMLKEKYDNIDYKRIENMTHEQALEAYKECDILIDQLRIGWYGVLSCEAMALGKVVMVHIRNDLVSALPEECPLVNVCKENLYQKLEALLNSKELRQTTALAAKDYAKINHHSEVVGRESIETYENLKTKCNEGSLSVGVIWFLSLRRRKMVQRILGLLKAFFLIAVKKT